MMGDGMTTLFSFQFGIVLLISIAVPDQFTGGGGGGEEHPASKKPAMVISFVFIRIPPGNLGLQAGEEKRRFSG